MNFITYVAGIILIAITATVVFMLGHREAAWVIANLGTLAYMLLVLVYTAVWDSRKKWPRASASQRFVNILTFQWSDPR